MEGSFRMAAIAISEADQPLSGNPLNNYLFHFV
jgi:hypothetical protein